MKLRVTDIGSMTLGDLETFEALSGSTFEELAEGHLTVRMTLALIVMQQRETNPEYSMDDARKLKMDEIEFEQPVAVDPTVPPAKAKAKPGE